MARGVAHQTPTIGRLALPAGCGAAPDVLFQLSRGRLPRSPIAAGVLCGGALRSASYLGVMPALGLYAWPREDRPSRVAVMIGAHLVYGCVTAAADQMLSPGREPSALLRGHLPRG